MAELRLGIYGGTFNPPHLGHVAAARSFVSGVSLDKLLIMPTFLSPHKIADNMASAEDRIEMCRLAFADVENTAVSDYEVQKGGKSYTYSTLEDFSDIDVELYFLCGTDMLLTLDNWRHPEIIFKLATICFVRREDDEYNNVLIEKKVKLYQEMFSARIITLEHNAYPISSTEVREMILNGSATDAFLSPRVKDYIVEKGLYLSGLGRLPRGVCRSR